MPCPPKGGMVPAHDKLAVGIRLGLPDLDDVILKVRAQGIIHLHRPVAAPQPALRSPRPGVRMGEDGAVLLDSRIDPGHEADIVVRHRIGRRIQHQPVPGEQITVDTIHCLPASVFRRSPRQNGPGIALQMDPPLCVGSGSDLFSVFGDSADIPLSVPELLLTGPDHFAPHPAVMVCILQIIRRVLPDFPQIPGKISEMIQCPYMKK